MHLNTKVDTYYSVDYRHFELWVESTYGYEYDLVGLIEGHNDSLFEATASSKLSEYDRQSLEQWISDGKDAPWPGVILTDATMRGLIPSGQYLIRIFW